MNEDVYPYTKLGVYFSKSESSDSARTVRLEISREDLPDKLGVLVGRVDNLEGYGIVLDEKRISMDIIGGQSSTYHYMVNASCSLSAFLLILSIVDLFQTHIGLAKYPNAEEIGFVQPVQKQPDA